MGLGSDEATVLYILGVIAIGTILYSRWSKSAAAKKAEKKKKEEEEKKKKEEEEKAKQAAADADAREKSKPNGIKFCGAKAANREELYAKLNAEFMAVSSELNDAGREIVKYWMDSIHDTEDGVEFNYWILWRKKGEESYPEFNALKLPPDPPPPPKKEEPKKEEEKKEEPKKEEPKPAPAPAPPAVNIVQTINAAAPASVEPVVQSAADSPAPAEPPAEPAPEEAPAEG